jgi:hypothetical protein
VSVCNLFAALIDSIAIADVSLTLDILFRPVREDSDIIGRECSPPLLELVRGGLFVNTFGWISPIAGREVGWA